MNALGQLFRTYHKMHRLIESQLDKDGLTLPQVEALATLLKQPGMTQQELAEHLVVTKGNITGLIDRLAGRGLVERRADVDDRRVNSLYLTDEAIATLDRMIPAHVETTERVFEVLTDKERETLRELLSRLEQTL